MITMLTMIMWVSTDKTMLISRQATKKLPTYDDSHTAIDDDHHHSQYHYHYDCQQSHDLHAAESAVVAAAAVADDEDDDDDDEEDVVDADFDRDRDKCDDVAEGGHTYQHSSLKSIKRCDDTDDDADV